MHANVCHCCGGAELRYSQGDDGIHSHGEVVLEIRFLWGSTVRVDVARSTDHSFQLANMWAPLINRLTSC